MKKKILVIEDCVDIGKLFDSVLGTEYEVLILQEGNQVFDHLENFVPELILLDVMLPGMDGYELCASIKKHNKYSTIPIVFISGKQGSSSRSTAYGLGAINYLEKPFEVGELLLMVRSILQQAVPTESVILNIGDLSINFETQDVYLGEDLLQMTKSEFLLLAKMAKNLEVVFSRASLLEVLSPDNLESSDRSIDNHIGSLRKKLGKGPLQIKSVYGSGYKLILM